jgi:hypothetical protein
MCTKLIKLTCNWWCYVRPPILPSTLVTWLKPVLYGYKTSYLGCIKKSAEYIGTWEIGSNRILTYLLTYLLLGARYYLKSWLSLSSSKNIPGWWIKSRNEIHNLYSSTIFVGVVKPRRYGWAEHVSRIGDMRNAYKILARIPWREVSIWST